MEFGDCFTDPSPCCMKLRCKSMYYRADERPGLLHNEEAMTYWCSINNEPVGPDGQSAVHSLCQQGRGCYEAAPDF